MNAGEHDEEVISDECPNRRRMGCHQRDVSDGLSLGLMNLERVIAETMIRIALVWRHQQDVPDGLGLGLSGGRSFRKLSAWQEHSRKRMGQPCCVKLVSRSCSVHFHHCKGWMTGVSRQRGDHSHCVRERGPCEVACGEILAITM